MAPLAREKKLRGVFLEVSFPDGHPDELLFGHLTPSWMMAELRRLAQLTDSERPGSALRGLAVIVTHIKPSLKQGPSPRERIAEQLAEQDDLDVTFVFPQQGQRIVF